MWTLAVQIERFIPHVLVLFKKKVLLCLIIYSSVMNTLVHRVYCDSVLCSTGSSGYGSSYYGSGGLGNSWGQG